MAGGARLARPWRQNHPDAISGARTHRAGTRLASERDLPRDEVTAAFWHACRGGQQTTAEYMLEQGADLNWVGFIDWTPLQAAEDSGNQSLIGALRARGARRADEL